MYAAITQAKLTLISGFPDKNNLVNFTRYSISFATDLCERNVARPPPVKNNVQLEFSTVLGSPRTGVLSSLSLLLGALQFSPYATEIFISHNKQRAASPFSRGGDSGRTPEKNFIFILYLMRADAKVPLNSLLNADVRRFRRFLISLKNLLLAYTHTQAYDVLSFPLVYPRTL